MKKITIAIFLLILAGCNRYVSPPISDLIGPDFDIEGHRGCPALMPENTIPGFLKAADLNVTTLEMDAIITGDSQVVISHTPFLSHTVATKPDGTYVTEAEERSYNIYRMSYEEVKQFDVGMKPNPEFPDQKKMHAVVPLLNDVIDSVEAFTSRNALKPLYYNIETKCSPGTDNFFNPPPDRFVEMIMAIILQKNIADRVIIESFDIRSLQYLKQHYPYIKTSLLVLSYDPKKFREQIKALGFLPDIYSPAYQIATPALVKQCHDNGIKIIPWRVNDISLAETLIRSGADGIITDYPNVLKK